MFEVYSKAGTQIIVPHVVPHAPLFGVLVDFLIRGGRGIWVSPALLGIDPSPGTAV